MDDDVLRHHFIDRIFTLLVPNFTEPAMQQTRVFRHALLLNRPGYLPGPRFSNTTSMRPPSSVAAATSPFKANGLKPLAVTLKSYLVTPSGKSLSNEFV